MSRRNHPPFYLDLVKPICHVIGMIVGLIAMFAWLPNFLQFPIGFKSDSGPPWYVAVIGLVILSVSLSMLYDEEYEVRQKK